MRYIGSKSNIIPFLESTIKNCLGENLKGKVFADLFSGTGVVSRRFKDIGCQVISNDYMAFSYAFQVAYLKFNKTPELANFNSYQDAINQLNGTGPIKDFFYYNYTIEGTESEEYKRNYFSSENAQKIDGILKKIKDWKRDGYVNHYEEQLLRASLIDAATKVSNTSGTYGAFLKKDDKRKFKSIFLEPFGHYNDLFDDVVEVEDNDLKHECYNLDIFDIIKRVSGDVLYLDPPYNNRQYPPYYHILETLALDDRPAIYGKTGRRPYKEKMSPFSVKNKAEGALETVIENAAFDNIFVSYNNEGIISIENIEKIMSKFGSVKKFYKSYSRYKSNSFKNKTQTLKEVLFYVKKG